MLDLKFILHHIIFLQINYRFKHLINLNLNNNNKNH